MSGWLKLHLALVFVSTLVIAWSMPGQDRFPYLIGVVMVAVFVLLAPRDDLERRP